MRVELVTTLKRQATKILADLHTSKEPVLITEHGQPSAYLVDVEDYEIIQARMNILDELARGETALQQGRTFSHRQARDRLFLRKPFLVAPGVNIIQRENRAANIIKL